MRAYSDCIKLDGNKHMPLIGFGDKENLPKDLNFRHLSMFGGTSPLMTYSPILERLDIALPAAKSLSKPDSARNSPNISPELQPRRTLESLPTEFLFCGILLCRT